jgi:hypothetical protein
MSGKANEDQLSPADLEQLRRAGIDPGEADRQLALLRSPTPFAKLDRPCTAGDGITRIPGPEMNELIRIHGKAADAGRCVRFVPASGAATRMFKSLLPHLAGGGDLSRDALPAETATFLDNVERFAFREDLARALEKDGQDLSRLMKERRCLPVLRALLSPEGMGYADRAKGLLKFHDYPEGGRSPFEEHLVEAAHIARDRSGRCRPHFTVGASEKAGFEDLLGRVRSSLEKEHDVRLDVTFSFQKPSTDTLAVDGQGRPFHREDGTLLLRPSGHGALLENLIELDGDLVLIKNIDNVVPDRLKGPTFTWSRVIAGLALRLQERVFDLLRRMEDGADRTAAGEALEFARDTFHRGTGVEPGAAGEPGAIQARRALDRPIRVCGMVENTGEPGGGPFWAHGGEAGPTPQIVEGAQIDPGSREQKEILAASTHANPVFIACAVRDADGRPYDLRRYVDPGAVIITSKSLAGRDLRALERPGLWNGAMAGWNTVFVEVPLAVFNPVKTVNDLLREAHQPG